jgi:hypothetical protein
VRARSVAIDNDDRLAVQIGLCAQQCSEREVGDVEAGDAVAGGWWLVAGG